jgi:GNAT superfamily N-acetyltransferase
MRQQGHDEATSDAVEDGMIVSLGSNGFVNRLLCTANHLSRNQIVEVIAFFSERRLAPSIQVTANTDAKTDHLLRTFGFERDWQRVVMAAPVRSLPESPLDAGSGVSIGVVDDASLHDWLDVLARGNGVVTPQARARSDRHGLAAHAVLGSVDLLARLAGSPVACGSLQYLDRICWLGGAATLPDLRNRGLQRRLLEHRLALATDLGAEFVAATAVAGGASTRNLERVDLTLIDTQQVWTRRPDSGISAVSGAG